jgi:hypothetical protein
VFAATITRYREQLGTILRWVPRPETDQRYAQAQREGALVDGFVAPVGDRDGYTDDLYSGKKHTNGQNIQVVADLDGLVADVATRRPPRRGGVLAVGHRRAVAQPLSARRNGHDRR